MVKININKKCHFENRELNMSDKSKKHSKQKLAKPALEKKHHEQEKISKKELEKVHGGLVGPSGCCIGCGNNSCTGC
jgi:hypothetical protein